MRASEVVFITFSTTTAHKMKQLSTKKNLPAMCLLSFPFLIKRFINFDFCAELPNQIILVWNCQFNAVPNQLIRFWSIF